MSDDDFSRTLGFPGGLQRNVCVEIRKIAASRCKLDPDSITPSGDTELLNRKTFDGWDNAACLMDLESAFGVSLAGVELPNFTQEGFFFFYKKGKPANFGAWVRKAVGIVTPIVAEQMGNQHGNQNRSDSLND